jgi:O-antigen ligase
LAYGLIVILSATFAYDRAVAFANLDAFYPWVIVYFAFIGCVTTPTRFFLIISIFLLCNFKMIQHGFLSWAGGGFSFNMDGVVGAPGWFHNSGEFGIQLCLIIPLLAEFIAAVRPHCGRVARWFLYTMLVMALGSIIATSSRGAYLGLAAAAAYWLVQSGRLRLRYLVMVAVVGTAIWVATPEQLVKRFESAGEDRTSVHRLDRWQKGIETIKAFPLLGVGHKNWEVYFYDRLDYGEPGTPMVHNMFIESGTEHGLLGLAALASLIFAMFKINSNSAELARARSDDFSRRMATGLSAGLVGLIVSGSFVTVLYYPFIWIQAAMTAALNISLRSGDPAR